MSNTFKSQKKQFIYDCLVFPNSKKAKLDSKLVLISLSPITKRIFTKNTALYLSVQLNADLSAHELAWFELHL